MLSGGMTIESVNAMQDEMNKIGEEDTADADALKAAEDATKLAEAKAAEDAKALADAEAAKKLEGDGSKAKDDEGVDVIRELKEQNRQSQAALDKITSDYQKLQKLMIDKGVISEDEVKQSKEDALKQEAALAQRQEKLIEIVTLMELNPLYTDVRTVCSQSNLDDVIDAFSRFYVKENGGKPAEVALMMETEIWAEPNPYKRIYELVKKYHPKFAVADDAEAKKVKEAEETAKKAAADADGVKTKEKKAVDSQDSAAKIGAGGSGAGATGWTPEKIDALPEDELNTVPKDVYDKYLKGTLK